MRWFFSTVWVKIHFPLKSPVMYHFKILVKIICRSLVVTKTENKDALSANNLALVESPSERLFIKIKNNNRPRMETWGTPAMTFVHVEIWPVISTCCFLSLKKSRKSWSKLHDIPCWVNLKILRSCQTLSNALEMSKKTPLTSWPSSRDLWASHVIDTIWFTQESPGLKPDWFDEISSF